MATLLSGLGGTAGYGENTFSTASGRTGNLDDGSINVNLTSVFGATGINLYGTAYTSVFINTNGLLTFGSAQASYTPAALTTLNQPAIAPFWTDIDINKGGQIYWDLDPSTGKFTVTWLNVAPYSGSGTNSFQVVLTSLGGGDVDIEFIYGSIGFANGGYGAATVGISNGTNSQTLVEGSGDPAFLLTYANNDFDTLDPAGVWSVAYEGGQPFLGDGVIEGTAGNDLIDANYTGDPELDRVDGLDGTGFAGTTGNADYILAGAGHDTVISGLGNDIIYGGAGNDQIFAGQGNDWVDGGTEADSIDGGSGNDSLYGGAGNDTLFGGSASAGVSYTPSYTEVTVATQTVVGTSGRPNFAVRSTSNETLTLGTNGAVSGFQLGDGDSTETHTHTASSQLSGGQLRFNGISGTETLTITIDGVTLNLNTAIANGMVTFNGAGLYQINGAGQIVRIGNGGTSATVGTLTINVPYTTISLSSTGTTASAGMWYEYFVNTQPLDVAPEAGGNDLIYGGDGADLIDGGDGNDTLHGDVGHDTIDGNTGNDFIYGGSGDDFAYGGAGDDRVEGGDGNDYLSGGLGNDTVYGGADNDTIFGGGGNDLLYGDAGNDLIYDDAGNSIIYGGTGNDVVFGYGGDDLIYGGEDRDHLFGGLGNDTLAGEAGNDTLEGDEGDDSLNGGTGDDQLFGGSGNDTLVGDTGNDLLSGGLGDNSLDGGAGNDTFIGGAGVDTIFGGQGLDWVDYSASTAGVTIDLTAGTASGGHAQGDVLNGIDALLGSAYDDVLLGYNGSSTNPADAYTNIFFGNAGNDYIDGRGGDDSLYGGADNDTVLGGAGNDLVDGGDGNDLLFGGSGDDTILGGEGDDLIYGGAGADHIDGGSGNDTIVVGLGTDDFGDTVFGGEKPGDYDVLDLSAWGWALTNVIYDPGNPENGIVQFLDANGAVIGTMSFSGIEKVIPCFTPGTLISTDRGEVPVEDLRAGDRVVTRDNGLQTVRWTGRRDLSLADLIVNPALQPVEIAAGALGQGLPMRDMKVSPQHRMLVEGARAEMLFGEAEVLVAATHLTALAGVAQRLTAGVSYIHVLFDRHEIICANGAWTESFQPAMRTLDAMDSAQVAEIAALFPELVDAGFDYPAARLSLKAHEARVLLAR